MDTPFTEDCHHESRENNICTACGLCFEDLDLRSGAPQLSFSPVRLPMKFHVRDPSKTNDPAIEKVLTALNLAAYRNVLRNLMNDARFTLRIKREDKVIVAAYHLLKLYGFPLVISDLLKFTTMTKYRLLKVHRDTFEYVNSTREYLLGIYERVEAFLAGLGLQHSGRPEIFFRLADTHKSADPKALCLAYFLESNKLSNLVLREHEDVNLVQIVHIRRKIRGLCCEK